MNCPEVENPCKINFSLKKASKTVNVGECFSTCGQFNFQDQLNYTNVHIC